MLYLARAVAFAVTGFDPDEAELTSDCDQCTLTETLDVLPWIAVACLTYLAGVAALAFLTSRRRGRSQGT